MAVTIGRIVFYMLGADDVEHINRRRTDSRSIARRISEGKWPTGAQAHVGNEVKAGQQFPMLVTKVWMPGCANGQVFLDGNDSLWVTSVIEGTVGHTWQWAPDIEFSKAD